MSHDNQQARPSGVQGPFIPHQDAIINVLPAETDDQLRAKLHAIKAIFYDFNRTTLADVVSGAKHVSQYQGYDP